MNGLPSANAATAIAWPNSVSRRRTTAANRTSAARLAANGIARNTNSLLPKLTMTFCANRNPMRCALRVVERLRQLQRRSGQECCARARLHPPTTSCWRSTESRATARLPRPLRPSGIARTSPFACEGLRYRISDAMTNRLDGTRAWLSADSIGIAAAIAAAVTIGATLVDRRGLWTGRGDHLVCGRGHQGPRNTDSSIRPRVLSRTGLLLSRVAV